MNLTLNLSLGIIYLFPELETRNLVVVVVSMVVSSSLTIQSYLGLAFEVISGCVPKTNQTDSTLYHSLVYGILSLELDAAATPPELHPQESAKNPM